MRGMFDVRYGSKPEELAPEHFVSAPPRDKRTRLVAGFATSALCH